MELFWITFIRMRALFFCFLNAFSNFCRYPSETMQLVAHLSTGIVEEYRERKKGKLQRTFIQGSDAASAKIKGRIHCESWNVFQFLHFFFF